MILPFLVGTLGKCRFGQGRGFTSLFSGATLYRITTLGTDARIMPTIQEKPHYLGQLLWDGISILSFPTDRFGILSHDQCKSFKLEDFDFFILEDQETP
jgi:hypothetical protein